MLINVCGESGDLETDRSATSDASPTQQLLHPPDQRAGSSGLPGPGDQCPRGANPTRPGKRPPISWMVKLRCPARVIRPLPWIASNGSPHPESPLLVGGWSSHSTFSMQRPTGRRGRGATTRCRSRSTGQVCTACPSADPTVPAPSPIAPRAVRCTRYDTAGGPAAATELPPAQPSTVLGAEHRCCHGGRSAFSQVKGLLWSHAESRQITRSEPPGGGGKCVAGHPWGDTGDILVVDHGPTSATPLVGGVGEVVRTRGGPTGRLRDPRR